MKKTFRTLLLSALILGLSVFSLVPPTVVSAAPSDWSVGDPVSALDAYTGLHACTVNIHLVAGQSAVYASTNGTTYSSVLAKVVKSFDLDGGVFYAATADDGVYKSTNGTTWTDANNGGIGDNKNVTSVVARQGDIFAANYASSTIMCSANGGTTWSNVKTGVTRPRNMRFGADSYLYVSSDGGLYRTPVTNNSCSVTWTQSSTTGASWSVANDVLVAQVLSGGPWKVFVATNAGIFMSDAWATGTFTNIWNTQQVFTLADWGNYGIVVGTNSLGVYARNPVSGTWAELDPHNNQVLTKINKIANTLEDGCAGYGYVYGNDSTVSPINLYGSWRYDMQQPTAVTLTDFAVAAYHTTNTNAGARVTWTTGMEVNNYGFELESKCGLEADWTQVAFIAAQYPGTGGNYTYDQTYNQSGAEICPTTNYWLLIDIDTFGEYTPHGPINMSFASGMGSITFNNATMVMTFTTNTEAFMGGNVEFYKGGQPVRGICPISGYTQVGTTAVASSGQDTGNSYNQTVASTGCAYIKVAVLKDRCKWALGYIDLDGNPVQLEYFTSPKVILS